LSRLGLFFVPDFIGEADRNALRGEIAEVVGEPAPVLRAGAPVLDTTSRHATIAQISTATTAALQARFSGLIPELEAHFRMALHECEQPQCLVYERGSFFSAHRDDGGAGGLDYVRRRRISAVVFLDDQGGAPGPGSFTGGELVCFGLVPGWPPTFGVPVPAVAGLLVAFDAGITHGVQPVVEGTRRTVVTWYSCPPEVSA
jgi:SM-20-related protein